jgi:hypothetical protein
MRRNLLDAVDIKNVYVFETLNLNAIINRNKYN